MVFWNEWKEVTAEDLFQHQAIQIQTIKWEKPRAGWYKLNVEAAIDKANGRMGFGWVLRNERGDFMAAVCQPWQEISHQRRQMQWQ